MDTTYDMDLKVGEKKQRAEEPAPIEKTSEELDMEIVNFLMNETEGLFNLIDIDGDGKIGMLELQSFYRSEGIPLSFEDADIILRDMGMAVDGYVNFDEFNNSMYDELRETVSEDILADVFRMIDTDKDGYLSIIDVAELYRRLGVNLTPTEADDLMKNCDTSEDGLVDYEEFKAYFGRTNKYLHLLEEKEEQVKREAERAAAEEEETGQGPGPVGKGREE